MLAQRNTDARIDALDIDRDACLQAAENVSASPFAARIRVLRTDFRTDIRTYAATAPPAYDRIVSNPPYFDESLKCPDAGRRMARHSDTLPMGELLSVAAALLTDDGRVALVLPYAQREGVLRLAEARALHLVRETHVVPVEGASPKRWLAELARRPSPCVPDVLTLETLDHRRTAAYAELMRAFYL